MLKKIDINQDSKREKLEADRLLVINKKIKVMSIVTIILITILVVIMFIDLVPLMKIVIDNTNNEYVVVKEINSFGAKGIIIMISLSILQVFSMVIPSTPIQILAGLSYGVFYGYIISILGFMTGNVMMFLLARKFRDIFHFAENENQLGFKKRTVKWDLSFMQKTSNLTMMAFLLFLIPGVPNGILPYIFANTKIKLSRFSLSLVLACSPSIIMSILIGERISKSDVRIATAIMVVLILTSLLTFAMRKKILRFLEKHSS